MTTRTLLCVLLTATFVYGVAGNDVVIGILGSSVSIECSLPLSETLVWEDSRGNIIAMHGIVSGSLSRKYVIEKQNGVREILVIHELTLEDEMQYRCYDLRNKTATEVFKLNVLVEPAVMGVTYPDEPALEGTEVTLVCEADGGKPLPDIKWFRIDSAGVSAEVSGIVRDVAYSNGTGDRRSSITVNVTRDTYKTLYVCNISVSVFYQRSLKVDLNVQLMPQQPVITGYHDGYDVGNVMTLECTSTGSLPTATVFWLQDNVRVGDYEFVVIPEGNGMFTVKSFFKRTMTRDFNASVLTCAATNIVLAKQGMAPRMANLTLQATYKPIVTILAANHTSPEGDAVTLTCNVDARPDPDPATLVWLHDGIVVDRSKYIMPNGTRGFRLELKKMSRLDAGQYSCGATNRLGASSSGPVFLTVLYAPVCASSSVGKRAARLGDNIRLHCQMQTLPSNVTLLWRYSHDNTLINTAPAITDDNRDDIVYGTFDLLIKSYSHDTAIACYGLNSVGKSLMPCEFEIVPPSAPESPMNCSVSYTGSNISVVCGPGFDGGSRQHFILQQRTEIGFQTLKNSSKPMFSLSSASNVTVRVCSVNVEFSHVTSCAAPMTVVVHASGDPSSKPVSTRKANTTAYIAGGVTAMIGLLVITAAVIFFVKKNQKQCRKSDIPSSLEELIKQSQKDTHRKSKQVLSTKSIWTAIRSIGKPRGKARHTFKTGRNCDGIARLDVTNEDVTFQQIQVIASTPYNTLKHYQQDSEQSLPVSLSDFQPKRSTDGELNILRSSSGLILSPISIHLDKSRTVFNQELDNKRSRDDHTDADFGHFYNTADIMDVLGETKNTTSRLECTYPKEETVDYGLVTRNRDYSAGDIFEVLGDCKSHLCDSIQISYTDSETVLADSTRWLKIQAWNGSCNTDFSKFILLENDSNTSSTLCGVANKPSGYSCVCANQKTLRKIYSLPTKSKTQHSHYEEKYNSLQDIKTISDEDTMRLPTLTHGFYSKLFASKYMYSKSKSDGDDTGSDTEDTICDTDTYYVNAMEHCSDNVLSADDSVIEIVERENDIDLSQNGYEKDGHIVPTVLQSGGNPRHNFYRSNSFLSAISHCDSTPGESIRCLLGASDSVQTYSNQGFDPEDDVDIHKSPNSHEDPDNVNTNVVAYF